MESKLDFVDRLIGLERRICRVYQKWAANENLSAELRRLFGEIAEEEKEHLVILEHSAGMLNLAAPPPQTAAAQMESIAAKISAAEQVSNKPEQETDEVLSQILALESSELNQLDDAWLRGFQPDLGNLIRSWVPAHSRHINRVAAAITQLTANENLHKAAAKLLVQSERQKAIAKN